LFETKEQREARIDYQTYNAVMASVCLSGKVRPFGESIIPFHICQDSRDGALWKPIHSRPVS